MVLMLMILAPLHKQYGVDHLMLLYKKFNIIVSGTNSKYIYSLIEKWTARKS
jgi:hypothetical protein